MMGWYLSHFKYSNKKRLILGALVHKHRPKLLDYNSLDKTGAEKIQNLTKVMDAAERFFGLEKYLKPEDIQKLDENSMVVYVSE